MPNTSRCSRRNEVQRNKEAVKNAKGFCAPKQSSSGKPEALLTRGGTPAGVFGMPNTVAPGDSDSVGCAEVNSGVAKLREIYGAPRNGRIGRRG